MSISNEEQLLSSSTYVINVEPKTRSSWHRHFTKRCKRCRTFLVFHCDSSTLPSSLKKQECEIKSHANNTKWDYALGIDKLPSYVKNELKWNECRKHISE